MECPICFKIYQLKENFAVKLPCFHTFCIECVRKYSKLDKIVCSFCHKVFKTEQSLEKCKTIQAILLSRLGELKESGPAEQITLLVRNFKGSMLELNASPEDTVESLKQQIQEIEGISPKAQWLLCKGKPMQDAEKLKDYHLSKTDTVFMVIRSFGG